MREESRDLGIEEAIMLMTSGNFRRSGSAALEIRAVPATEGERRGALPALQGEDAAKLLGRDGLAAALHQLHSLAEPGGHSGVRSRPGLGPVPDRPEFRVAHRLRRHGHRAGEQGAGQDQQPVHNLEIRLQDHRGERAEYVRH